MNACVELLDFSFSKKVKNTEIGTSLPKNFHFYSGCLALYSIKTSKCFVI